VLIGLMIFSFIISARLKESKILTAAGTVTDQKLQVETVQNQSPLSK